MLGDCEPRAILEAKRSQFLGGGRGVKVAVLGWWERGKGRRFGEGGREGGVLPIGLGEGCESYGHLWLSLCV